MTTYVAHSNANNFLISITIYKTKLLINRNNISEYYLTCSFYNNLLFITSPLSQKECTFPEQTFPMKHEPNINETQYPHRIKIKAYFNTNSDNFIGELTIPFIRIEKKSQNNEQTNSIKQWYYLKNRNEEIVCGILLSIQYIRFNMFKCLNKINEDNISICNELYKQIDFHLNELSIKEQYHKYQQINIESVLHSQNISENYIKQISSYISKETNEILLTQNIQRNNENILLKKQKNLSFIFQRDKIIQDINLYDETVISHLNYLNILHNKNEMYFQKQQNKKCNKHCNSQFKLQKQISRTSYVNNSMFLNYKLDKTGKSTCLTSNNISLISFNELSMENNKISISQEFEKKTLKSKIIQKKKAASKHINKSTFCSFGNHKPKIINISLRNSSKIRNNKVLNSSKTKKIPK